LRWRWRTARVDGDEDVSLGTVRREGELRRRVSTGRPTAVFLRAVAALAAALTASCGLPEVRPPVAVPAAFSRSGEAAPVERWWTELDDPALNGLVDAALGRNFDLLSAWDRLAQAAAVARREGAPLFPTIDLETTTTRTEITQSAQQGSGVGGRNDTRIGLAASYEIDLWGRVRATRDAARLDTDASYYDLQAAAMTLAAEVARTWYELVEQRRLLDIAAEQLRTNERVLELITLRFRRGQVLAADVLRQRQLVEATRGERLLIEARAGVLEHQLAILTGQTPQAAALPGDRELRALPPLPETGVAAEVVDGRPDVRQAFANLLAADRRLAAAKADRYPRLTLSGSASLAAEDLRDLLDNWIASVAAGVVQPLIDGGRRSAEVDRTEALVSERWHQYGQTILVSLQEVEDALVQEEQQRLRNLSLEKQLEIAQSVVERVRDQYLYGSINYLDVLQALSSQQELQRSRTTAQRQLLGYRIDLYRAIGGGLDLERPQLADATAAEGMQ
jgi:NodT family efflux transporter outer membrane factor (OMF) lipoprotein